MAPSRFFEQEGGGEVIPIWNWQEAIDLVLPLTAEIRYSFIAV